MRSKFVWPIRTFYLGSEGVGWLCRGPGVQRVEADDESAAVKPTYACLTSQSTRSELFTDQGRRGHVKDNQGASVSKVKTSRFDTSERLGSEELIAAYLNATLEEGGSDLLMAAIADIAKARGIAKVAADAGVGPESPRLMP